jgi:hypothetical protein
MLEAFTSVSLLPGRVELAEASLLSATALSSQTPSFLLAILQFRAIEAGFSRVSFSQIVVDDPFGAKLSVSGQDASIAVAAVPESSAWILLVAGLLARAVSGAPGWRRRRAE